VGSYIADPGVVVGLIETESQGTWSAAEAPVPADAAQHAGSLQGISCAAIDSCVAVGTYITQTEQFGLIDTFVSGAWTTAAISPPGGSGALAHLTLEAVSCESPGICAAVGQYFDQSGSREGLTAQQDGATWTSSEAPTPSDAASNPMTTLSGVSCASAGACTAVGGYTTANNYQPGLLETLKNGTWVATTAPIGGGETGAEVHLLAVNCLSSTTCTTVGVGADQPTGLVGREVDGVWSATSAPLPAGESSTGYLNGVWCAADNSCKAAGFLGSRKAVVDTLGKT